MTDNVGSIVTKDMRWTQYLLAARDPDDPAGVGKYWNDRIEEASRCFTIDTMPLLELVYIEGLGEVAVARVYSGPMNDTSVGRDNQHLTIDIVLIVDQEMVAVRKDTLGTSGHHPIVHRSTHYCLLDTGFALLRYLNNPEIDPTVKDEFEIAIKQLIITLANLTE